MRLRRKPDPSIPKQAEVTQRVVDVTAGLADGIHLEMTKLSQTLARMRDDPTSVLYQPNTTKGLPHGRGR